MDADVPQRNLSIFIFPTENWYNFQQETFCLNLLSLIFAINYLSRRLKKPLYFHETFLYKLFYRGYSHKRFSWPSNQNTKMVKKKSKKVEKVGLFRLKRDSNEKRSKKSKCEKDKNSRKKLNILESARCSDLLTFYCQLIMPIVSIVSYQ